MYKALDIAKYIVTKCVQDDCPVTNVRLNQQLYYVQRYFLKETGKPAFKEKLEAHKFGVAVCSVYRYFLASGITTIVNRYDIEHIRKRDRKKIDRVLKTTKRLSLWEITNDICKKGGAWDKVYQGGKGLYDYIPHHLIVGYYINEIKKEEMEKDSPKNTHFKSFGVLISSALNKLKNKNHF